MTTETRPLRPAVLTLPTPVRRRRPGRRGRQVRAVVKHTLLIAACTVMIYPLLWLVVSSFKPNSEIFRDLSLISTNLTTQTYANGWSDLQHPFGLVSLSSTIIAVRSILGNLECCSSAASAFSRLRFRGRNPFLALMLGSIMLPFQVLLVP